MEFHFRGRQAEGEPRPPLFLFGAEDGKSCRWTGAGAQPLGSGKWARATPIVYPKESPLVRPQAHTLFCWGLPRRLRREQWGLPPYGALTLFFRWRKKSVQKKASGTATPGKSPLLPIFERGSSQCRAQHSWIAITCYRARSCSLFSSFKKGKAFSLRCLSPLCSPAVGGGHTQPLQVGMFSCGLGIFATQKASMVSKPCWPV